MVKQNTVKQIFDYDSQLFGNWKPLQVLHYRWKDQALQLLLLEYKINFTHTIQQSFKIALVPWNVYAKQKP